MQRFNGQQAKGAEAQSAGKAASVEQLQRALRNIKTAFERGRIDYETAKAAVSATGREMTKNNANGSIASKHNTGMIDRTVAACEYELGQFERMRRMPLTAIHLLEEAAKYGANEAERSTAMDRLMKMHAVVGQNNSETGAFTFAFVRIALRAKDSRLRRQALGIIKDNPMCILDIIRGCGHLDIIKRARAMLVGISFARYYETGRPAGLDNEKKGKSVAPEEDGKVRDVEEAGREEDEEEGTPDLCDIIESGKLVE